MAATKSPRSRVATRAQPTSTQLRTSHRGATVTQHSRRTQPPKPESRHRRTTVAAELRCRATTAELPPQPAATGAEPPHEQSHYTSRATARAGRAATAKPPLQSRRSTAGAESVLPQQSRRSQQTAAASSRPAAEPSQEQSHSTAATATEPPQQRRHSSSRRWEAAAIHVCACVPVYA